MTSHIATRPKNSTFARLAGFAWILALCGVLGACEFSELQEDLDKIEDRAHVYQGEVSNGGDDISGLVVLALGDRDGSEISAFRVLSGPGPYRLFSERRKIYLFAFEDSNLDFRFEAGERYGWARDGREIEVDKQQKQSFDIVFDSANAPPPPKHLLDRPLTYNLYGNHDFHFGTVTSLDDELLSLQQAKKGMWQPYSFIEDGGTGIHFQEPYDPDREPVLFVHGVLGSPVNFAPMIEKLDRERFQAWYVSYPSGFDMRTVSGGLMQFMEVVHRRYRFERLHLVAHSMGGLAARGALNQCQVTNGCAYVRTLTSISTPWSGVQAARTGLTWAPTVVPVWRDLSPDSEFVATLFDTPMPKGVPHYLLFGYRVEGLFPNESSDGVVGLSSQLRDAAQQGAALQRGFNEGHVSILANDAVSAMLNDLLRGEAPD